MSNSQHPLTKKEFDDIYSEVPRLTVEIILKNKDGLVNLTKRAIEPCMGQWHLPGGTVRFGEPLVDAVKRIAKRELGARVIAAINVGYIEYPSHFEAGLDYPVGIVFEITEHSNDLQHNDEAQDSGWFNSVPKDIHAHQDDFLIANGYLKQEQVQNNL